MSIWHDGKRTTITKVFGVTDAYLYLSDSQPIVKGDGFTTFAIDGAYPKIKPEIYICCEDEEKYKAVLKEPFVKIFRKKFSKNKVYSDSRNIYFVDLWLHAKGIEGVWHTNPDNFHAFWCNSTLGVALSIIVNMGYTRIFFCGASLNGYENYRDRVFIAEFNEIAKQHGVKCYCCTFQSSLNSFMPFALMPDVKEKLRDNI